MLLEVFTLFVRSPNLAPTVYLPTDNTGGTYDRSRDGDEPSLVAILYDVVAWLSYDNDLV